MHIHRLRLRSPDPSGLVAFYRRAFEADPWELGVSFGDERVEIGSCEIGSCETGDSEEFATRETGFQHFAVVVADIAAAYAQLQGFWGWRPISLDGPERLPDASGGASAFKFRDPDGHPLELLQFSADAVPPLWRSRFAAAPGRLFHGLDHTAITIRDADASVAFYTQAGFACRRRQVNFGVEQARLDGVADLAEARVAIASISPPEGARPGVELLEYREPGTVVRAARDGAVAATSMVIATTPHGRRPERDPDGHRLDYAPKLLA